METLRPGDDCDLFLERVRRTRQRALLLDYDGTLAPFRVERDAAVPYPGVRELLEEIIDQNRSRLVIVSGRWSRDLLPLLGLKSPPEIWGCHGWERLWPDGHLEAGTLPEEAGRALDRARRWAEEAGYSEHCESKPVTVALHWRGLDPGEVETMQRRVLEAWTPVARQGGMELHRFDGGLELRYPGCDKGTAVRQVLLEMGEPAAVAYLGDDLTDEDAFRTLQGKGLGILVRGERRATEAGLWLRPPEELLDFLRLWLAACKNGEET